MARAFRYLITRFCIRIGMFLHHWYVEVPIAFARTFESFHEYFEEKLALTTTLKQFFHPLPVVQGIPGRTLGLLYRTVRVSGVGALYCVTNSIIGLALIVWLLVPPLVVSYGLHLLH